MEENKNETGLLPICMVCSKGALLPFSFKEDVFEKWQCSNPDCDYMVRKNRQ